MSALLLLIGLGIGVGSPVGGAYVENLGLGGGLEASVALDRGPGARLTPELTWTWMRLGADAADAQTHQQILAGGRLRLLRAEEAGLSLDLVGQAGWGFVDAAGSDWVYSKDGVAVRGGLVGEWRFAGLVFGAHAVSQVLWHRDVPNPSVGGHQQWWVAGLHVRVPVAL